MMREKNLDESKQERKNRLGLSGEFLVAGELLRRNIGAAITFGNAKKADVVATNERSTRSIEVKTTREPKWLVGGTVPEPNDSLWVLVYLPRDDLRPAEFFVLTGLELHAILKPKADEWLEKCLKKHGHPMPAVYSVRRDEIADHNKDAWQKITIALGRSSDPATLRKASSQF
jgi:hypothetical protein